MIFTVDTENKVIVISDKIELKALVNQMADMGLDLEEWSISGVNYTYFYPYSQEQPIYNTDTTSRYE